MDKDWLAEGVEDPGDPGGSGQIGKLGTGRPEHVVEHSVEAAWEKANEPDDTSARADAGDAEGRYRKLPERIRVEDMIATKDTRPVPDPKMGRDTETDFMLRNAGVFG